MVFLPNPESFGVSSWQGFVVVVVVVVGFYVSWLGTNNSWSLVNHFVLKNVNMLSDVVILSWARVTGLGRNLCFTVKCPWYPIDFGWCMSPDFCFSLFDCASFPL